MFIIRVFLTRLMRPLINLDLFIILEGHLIYGLIMLIN